MGSKPLVLGLLAREGKGKVLDFIEWALLVASAQAEWLLAGLRGWQRRRPVDCGIQCADGDIGGQFQ
ncbi:hypothetical protein [Burkholderia ubonensis]|uniref:hypothetical protein n=1 Tax=Burkholderia ubonensis TaxID=101571 RepID=UPI00075207CF|nr:hypothetical protein [Burkholderia ubonensis]KVD81105.1 hypothetical protein WI88_19685 [Burkholderia ubonensis]